MCAHFRSKLTDADSEAAETQSWLEFALRCGYITQAVFDELDAAYEKVSGGLVNMMAHADQWCISNNQVREDGVEYHVTEDLTPTNPQTHKLLHPRTHALTHSQTRP